MLVAQCPGCKKKYKAPESAAGRKLKCPGCGASFMIVKPKESDPETDFDLGPSPGASPSTSTEFSSSSGLSDNPTASASHSGSQDTFGLRDEPVSLPEPPKRAPVSFPSARRHAPSAEHDPLASSRAAASALGSSPARSEPEAKKPTLKAATVPSWKLPDQPGGTIRALPSWQRNLHWLLLLAMIPLAFSLLASGKDDNVAVDTLDDPTADTSKGDLSLDDATPGTNGGTTNPGKSQAGELPAGVDLEQLRSNPEAIFLLLPGHKLPGALLARDSMTHWVFAGMSTAMFFLFLTFLAMLSAAKPLQILGIGFFTATIGIFLLLAFQWIAFQTSGWVIRGNILVMLVFYVVKLIGFSYACALDPDTGFLLSFFGFTAGVGFCEELCKAIPVLFFIRKNDLGWRSAFILGLASGAGFGISEGITYSSDYYNGIHGADAYLVRFISCVALHAVWSGSVAITMQQNQELIEKAEGWDDWLPLAVRFLGIPMVLHGLYDTLLKKEMPGSALGIAALSFLYLAFVTSRLHGKDDQAAEAFVQRLSAKRYGNT